jgi:hypothetical protein
LGMRPAKPHSSHVEVAAHLGAETWSVRAIGDFCIAARVTGEGGSRAQQMLLLVNSLDKTAIPLSLIASSSTHRDCAIIRKRTRRGRRCATGSGSVHTMSVCRSNFEKPPRISPSPSVYRIGKSGMPARNPTGRFANGAGEMTKPAGLGQVWDASQAAGRHRAVFNRVRGAMRVAVLSWRCGSAAAGADHQRFELPAWSGRQEMRVRDTGKTRKQRKPKAGEVCLRRRDSAGKLRGSEVDRRAVPHGSAGTVARRRRRGRALGRSGSAEDGVTSVRENNFRKSLRIDPSPSVYGIRKGRKLHVADNSQRSPRRGASADVSRRECAAWMGWMTPSASIRPTC